jgi:hypothetical protein
MNILLLASLAIAALAIYYTTLHILRSREIARKTHDLGCVPFPALPEKFWDPLGLKLLSDNVRVIGEGTELQYWMARFEELSVKEGRPVKTFSGQFLRIPFLLTTDPKIIQAVLATQFREFELGMVRCGSFAPL